MVPTKVMQIRRKAKATQITVHSVFLLGFSIFLCFSISSFSLMIFSLLTCLMFSILSGVLRGIASTLFISEIFPIPTEDPKYVGISTSEQDWPRMIVSLGVRGSQIENVLQAVFSADAQCAPLPLCFHNPEPCLQTSDL